VEAARQDADALRIKLGELLDNERNEISQRLSSETQAEVFALTRKVLSDLADVAIEDRMVEVFIRRLRTLPESQRRLVTADTSAARPVALVRSAFELSLARRTAIKAAVGESLTEDTSMRFELSPELVCGIELTVGGVKLAWSVTDYLTSAVSKLKALVTPAQGSPLPPSLEAQHG
jgi:F-type H+-transporting ATPase subunit b